MKPMLLSCLLVTLMELLGCAKQIPPSEFQTQFPHDKNEWVQWRAQETKTDLENALKTDTQWGAANKPNNYGASYQLQECRALWQLHCALCHGPKGKTNPQAFEPAPRKLGGMGMKMGFFFGGDKMRAGLFHKIKTGRSLKKKKEQRMAGFDELLKNEQIWALVLHMENL